MQDQKDKTVCTCKACGKQQSNQANEELQLFEIIEHFFNWTSSKDFKSKSWEWLKIIVISEEFCQWSPIEKSFTIAIFEDLEKLVNKLEQIHLNQVAKTSN